MKFILALIGLVLILFIYQYGFNDGTPVHPTSHAVAGANDW
jgi:hypothetical protein